MRLASVEGTTTIRAQRRSFVEAFGRRIGTGLLRGTPERRSRYLVTREDAGQLAFRAADWPTALNVGLNEVELDASSDGHVRYEIRYGRWAAYAFALSAALGLAMIGVFVAVDIRDYLTRHPRSTVPGLSVDQNAAIAWTMAVFWGFGWPWILLALHKRPLRRLMDHLIAEVDDAVVAASAVGNSPPA